MVKGLLIGVVIIAAALFLIFYASKLAVRFWNFLKRESDEDYQLRRQATKEFNESREDLEEAIEKYETKLKGKN
tara:strand:- start:209 stop:430 length:222 start_codon:yes stop_codon:yes gene_type:complete